MAFARPALLGLLVLVVPLAFGVALARRRRLAGWRALGHEGRPPGDGAWGWLAAIALLIVALAGPQWGRAPGSELPPGHDVVVLIDVSRSMAAEDAVPNRLGLAVEAAEALIEELGRERGGRVAVVAFAGRGVLRCPLTANLGAAVEALRRLRPGDVQPGGSDLGAALVAALDAFDPDQSEEPEEGRTIILLSDGEDHEPTWQAALPALDAAKVIVHTVAIGDDAQGHPIPINDPSGAGRRTHLTYRGEPVETRRNDAPLRAIAEATGGAFLPLGLSPPAGLADLYRDRIAPVARRTRAVTRTIERVERYGLFVVAALAVGLAGSWPGCRRPALVALLALAVVPGAGRVGAERPPIVEAGPARSSPAARDDRQAQTAADRRAAREAVQRGGARFARGDLDGALAAYEQAMALDPASPLPRYNAAATLFALGRYAEAQARYLEARSTADPALRTKIDYALGNTAVALGDFAAAVAHYDACLASNAPGSALDAVRRDAAINRAFAERYRQVEADRRPGPEPGGEPAPVPSPGHDSPNDQQPPRSPGPSNQGGNTGIPPSSGPGQPPGEPPPASAGATQPPPDTKPTGSPRERLDRALDNARRSRQLRIPDEPPTGEPESDRKTW